MADYLVTDAELEAVADAIRAQTGDGGGGGLTFPQGFIDAIESIEISNAGSVSYEFLTTGTSDSPVLPIPLTGDLSTLSRLCVGSIQDQRHNMPFEEESGYIRGCVVAEMVDILNGESYVNVAARSSGTASLVVPEEHPVYNATARRLEHTETYFNGVYWVLAIYEA